MRLEEYLKKKNLTQETFASLLNVSQSQINRLIKGTRSPSFKLIKKIKDVTNGLVTIDDFPMEPKPR